MAGIPGIGCKWLLWLEIAGNGWKWLVWLEWLEIAGTAGNCYKWLDMVRNNWKQLEIVVMAGN